MKFFSKKFFVPILLILLFIVSLLFLQGFFFPKDRGEGYNKSFTIKKGENVFTIAENLYQEKLIKHPILFKSYLFVTGTRAQLQAGYYELNSKMSIAEIVQKIIAGKTIKITITIPEGWNLRNIASYLEENEFYGKESFFKITGYPLVGYNLEEDIAPSVFNYSFLESKPETVGLEGFIFPDTYELEKNFELKDFVEKTLINFNQKLNQDLKIEIENQEKTIFEIITMASLIERELRGSEEREIAAGILWKRLDNNIALQVDASILYLTGRRSEIFKTDLEIDSPYNTYKYKGLPLGPICNPGIDSIKAVIYPIKSDYWYYLSTPEGETIFSRTLKEHNIAVAKHLK